MSVSENERGNKAVGELLEGRELSSWSEELGLCADELKEIISLVGPSVEAVRQYLARRMLSAWPLNY